MAGETVGVFEGHKDSVYSIAFSHDDKLLATASADKTAKLWSVGTRQNILTLTGHSKEVWGVAFSPDDQRLITVSDDKKIKAWNVSNGAEIKSMIGAREEVQVLAFSRDGRWFATGSADGTFTIWNAETYAPVRTSKEYENSINSIAFSSDGRTMASGDGDGIIRLWDIESGRELHTLTGHSSIVGNLAFSPDGRVLASAGYEDLTVKLWDVDEGREIRTLKEHNVDVFDVAFTPNGRFLISTSLDGSARVWHADSGELLLTLAVTDREGHWLAVTPEGLFDGSAVAWQRILWRFENKTFNYATVETYFNDFFHPSLLQEIFEGQRPQPPAGRDLAQRDRRRPSVAIQQVKASNNSAVGSVSGNVVSTDTRNITIKVEVIENIEPPADSSQPKNGGAQDVRMFRNGSLVRHWSGDVFDNRSGCVQVESQDAATIPGSTNAKPRKAVCTATVPIVAGDNEFIAYAFNHHNLKSDDSKPVKVIGERNLERKGTLYVLAIGINNYKDKSNNLNFAVSDVDQISQEVKAEQERLDNYSHTKIISLTDQLATKTNIELALRRFAEGEQVSASNDASPALKQEIEKIKDIQPEDAIVLYYAGHGTAVGERFYLLPHDFSAGSEEQLRASSISDVELNEVLERVNAGKVLMVIDACRSGQVLGGAKEGRGPMNSKGLAQLAYDKGMYILTAAQSFGAAKEVARTQTGKDIKHGLLTFALLEGLSKANKDNNGRINEREWMNYAVEQVPQMQIEEMNKRDVEIKLGGKEQGSGLVQRGVEPVSVEGEKETNPEQWNVQRPRVFYRRELEALPLIVARPEPRGNSTSP
jgi:uncharacterized caspase-like protein